MTHDPLCSVQDDDPLLLQLLCICGELSAARRETVAKAIAALEAIKPGDTIDPDAMWMWQESIAALQALQTP